MQNGRKINTIHCCRNYPFHCFSDIIASAEEDCIGILHGYYIHLFSNVNVQQRAKKIRTTTKS